MKRLSIVLGTIGFLAGCSQILGLGDYEVDEASSGSGGSGGGTGGIGEAGTGGESGGSGGSGGNVGGSGGTGGASGGSAGDNTGGTGGSGGIGGTTNTNTNTTNPSTTTVGTGGSAGAGGCDCDERNPCLTSECQDGQCVPQPLGTECVSGNFDGVCDDEQQCVPCVDDADDTEVDSGCPDTSPECDDTDGTPNCTGCTEDIDCNDDVDCTADVCDDGRCVRSVLPSGADCSDGVCNGTGASDSCVGCVDSQAVGLDAGCEDALPLCDASQSPAVCVECLALTDCDDDNECTSETCESQVCVSQTVAAGEPCSGGICSGVAGTEACGACLDTVAGNAVDQGCEASAPVCNMTLVPPACTGCTINTECDDGIECTTDACTGDGVCLHTPDTSLCSDSGYVCQPNQCVTGTGCTPVDVTETQSLLADGNFESGGGVWQETSSYGYNLVVSEYGSVLAHSPTRYAWLGGLFYEYSQLWQVVSVPEGAQSVTLTFYYLLSTDDPYYYLYDYSNVMGGAMFTSDGTTLLNEFMYLGNQDVTYDWTEFTTTFDATAWAGTDVQLYFYASIGGGYNGYGNTNFRLDTVSLSADVCQ